jgi:hypothetical protein
MLKNANPNMNRYFLRIYLSRRFGNRREKGSLYLDVLAASTLTGPFFFFNR